MQIALPLVLITLLVSFSGLATADETTYEPAQTPWGTPDFQGVWDFRTLTPLERPVEFGDKANPTPEEAKALLDKILPPDRVDEPTGISLEGGEEEVGPVEHRVEEQHGEHAATGVVVDPGEERLKTEFTGIRKTHVPLHSIIRIDEVESSGVSKIKDLPGNKNNVAIIPMETEIGFAPVV